MEKLKWGIVSSGKICHDFVNALNDPSGPAAAGNTVSIPSHILKSNELFAFVLFLPNRPYLVICSIFVNSWLN